MSQAVDDAVLAPSPTEVTGPPPIERERLRSRRRRRPSGEPPPLPRELRASGKYWLGLGGVVVLSWVVLFTVAGAGASITRWDVDVLKWISDLRVPGVTSVARALHALGSDVTIRILRWATILALLLFKRFRHLFVFLATVLAVGFITTSVSLAIARPRPLEIDIIGHWEGGAHPSRPIAALAVTLIGICYCLVVPGRARSYAKWGSAALIGALCLARLYLGVDHPTDVLVGTVVGVALPLIAFRLLTPNDSFPVTYRRKRAAHLDVDGPRGDAIRLALEQQLGVSVTDIQPFGLAGSGGSTPLRLTLGGEPAQELFAKLYASTHLRADRWYKLGRTLLYGRLEDESSFSTVRRLVQYEDYMLRVMRDADLPTPKPFGFVEITPEREYLLVTDFVVGAKELLEADVDDDIIDQGLRLVRALWDAGIAHRDVKPSNLLVARERVYLIDVAFGEVRPSPWRQAVDLANMMIVLAFRSDPDRVYRVALRYFTPGEIAEAFAATQSVTMPSQSRNLLKQARGSRSGRPFFRRDPARGDILDRFRELAPKRRPISIQRWSFRRVGLTLGVVLGSILIAFLAFANFQGAGLLAPPDATHAAFSAVTRAPDCRDPSDQMILMAQSVPGASLVPCLSSLPVGWHFQALDIERGSTHLFLDSDRAGFRAVEAVFSATCDTSGTTEVPTDEPGTTRFECVALTDDRYTGTRYYLFPGGCVAYLFDLSGEGRSALLEEAALAISFVNRAEAEAFLEEQTGFRI